MTDYDPLVVAAMWDMTKAIGKLEARLRAAEQVVEAARDIWTQSSGTQLDKMNALSDTLRSYDEAVVRVKEQ